MYKKILSLIFCILTTVAYAQDVTITGKVTDTKNEPLMGVNVRVKGTDTGVITDMDGNFSLKGNANSTLIFSYVGMTEQEIAYQGSPLTVVMQDDLKSLEEVVVIGYGTARKKDLTGSVVQVRPDKLQNENPKTVQDILRGTPGLSVGYDTSAKGGGEMRIRGEHSLYGDGGHHNPLLILDGMIFYGELSEINPDDIAQIDVLKDASAAAIYGAKASAGVIIITTKKGKVGKPVVNFTANTGWTQAARYRERFSPSEYLRHRQDWYETTRTYGIDPETGEYKAYQNGEYAQKPGYFADPNHLPDGISLDQWRGYTINADGESDMSIYAKRLGFMGNALENFLAGKITDWEDLSMRTGFNQDYTASLSGATEKVNYYLSLGYLKNEGVKRDDDYRAIRANMKVNAKVNKWLELGANVNFQDRSDGHVDMDDEQNMRNSPYASYLDEEGKPIQYPLSEEYSQRGYNYDFQKQYMDLDKGYTTFNTIFNAKVKLPFNITYSFNIAPRFQYFHDRYFMSAELPGSDPATRGVNREQTKRFDWSLNNTITWDQIFKEKHHVTLTLVQEAEEQESWKDRIEARNILPSDALGYHNTQNGAKENSSYSSDDSHQTATGMLARLFYGYDDRYMLTASIRRDGYSGFGENNKYAYFPSVGVAWAFTNEEFFKWQDIMSTGKLRVSFGQNGNRSLANPYLALANLYPGGGKMQGYINSNGELELMRYLMVDRIANPNLRWEKTQSWNIGLDFGFLNDRITGSIEYYNMQTRDMIMNERLPTFSGFSNITTNLGQVDNTGFEISLNTLNIDKPKFQWSSTFSLSYNKNTIRHLNGEREDILDEQGNVIGSKEMDDKNNNWFIGHPIGVIWNYRVDGIWQKDEVEEAAKYGQVPGDPKVANIYTADDIVNPDGTVTPVYNDKDKVFLGQKTAPVNWAFRNDFTLWKNFDLSINMYSFMGHKSLETMYLNNDDDGGRLSYGMANLQKKEYWTIDHPTNDYGRIAAKGPAGAESPGKVYNRSFIRLDNISLGYTLPSKWIRRFDLNKVKIYGSIRNVATWAADWKYYGDPETGDMGVRTYSLGVNLVF